MEFDFSTLITDRSNADTNKAVSILQKVSNGTATQEEIQQLYNGMLKGLYDFTDLNRVNACIEFLVERLKNAGYSVSVVLAGTYDRQNTPTNSELEQYRQNISTIRSIFPLASYVQETPRDMNYLTVFEANAIEQILIAVNGTLDRIEKTINLGWAMGIAHIGLYGSV